MLRIASFKRVFVPATLGVILLVLGGCNSAPPPTDPVIGEQRKQARIDAYGPSGNSSPKAGPGGGGQAVSGQAAARARANGGR